MRGMSDKYWGTDWSDEKEAAFRAEWRIRVAECPRGGCRRHDQCLHVRDCPGLVKYPISDEVDAIRLVQFQRALMARRLEYLEKLEAEEDAAKAAAKQAQRRGGRGRRASSE
jgi:hypothetical protein